MLISVIQESIKELEEESKALAKHPVAVLNRKNSPTSNAAGGTTISRGTLSKEAVNHLMQYWESKMGQIPILFLLLLD